MGSSEPDPAWNEIGFNDDLWAFGSFSIGYGDGDDSVLVDITTSIYLRYDLNVYDTNSHVLLGNPEQIKALIIYADYDDGFIAYLNGYEILRVNVDKSIPEPSYLQTTIRSLEAIGYREIYRPVIGFYIDAATLDSAHFGVDNVLAFHICNDSIDGSDMTFQFDYGFIDESFSYNLYWDESRFTKMVEIDSTELPIVIIQTDEFGYDADVFDEDNDNHVAHMGIICNPDNYNKPTDDFNDYNGRISMRLRGQTSRDYSKKSFKIETQDSLGENNNVPLVGMPPENDWILYGPFADKSLIKNEIVFNFGRKMGYYEPRTRFCEFIINERNLGLYALTEQIKRDNDRVNIARLNPDEIEGNDLTGGYIFRYDKDVNGIEIRYPNDDDIQPEQQNYLFDLWDSIDAIIYSNHFLDREIGYRKYYDDTTLIDYIIINEVTKNIDAYYYSCYMHKDRDDRDPRIKFGPLWDYDFSMGYSLWEDLTTTGWMFNNRSRLPIKRILQDTTFTADLAERWHTLREGMLHTDSVNYMIDSIVGKLEPYIERNYEVWPIIEFDLNWHESLIAGKTYEEEIENLKQWIEERSLWLDDNFDQIYFELQIYPSTYREYLGEDMLKLTNGYVFCSPNPFSGTIHLRMNFKKPGEAVIHLYDITGRKLTTLLHENVMEGINEYSIDVDNNFAEGIYFLKVYHNNKPFSVQKIIKTR